MNYKAFTIFFACLIGFTLVEGILLLILVAGGVEGYSLFSYVLQILYIAFAIFASLEVTQDQCKHKII